MGSVFGMRFYTGLIDISVFGVIWWFLKLFVGSVMGKPLFCHFYVTTNTFIICNAQNHFTYHFRKQFPPDIPVFATEICSISI